MQLSLRHRGKVEGGFSLRRKLGFLCGKFRTSARNLISLDSTLTECTALKQEFMMFKPTGGQSQV